MTQKLILRHGDCVEVLKEYADGSIGAIVSDPPYDLISTSRGGSPRNNVSDPSSPWSAGAGAGVARGFMGKKWDGTGIAFSADLWDEVYRVLRPGGVVKAFSGTRTYHRMAAAMAEAGFVDLRVESWNYGSGFPKSMNIGKALDKAAGVAPAARVPAGGVGMFTEAHGTGGRAHKRKDGGWNETKIREVMPPPTTEAAQRWEGWGTALKPSWEPVVVGRKPE